MKNRSSVSKFIKIVLMLVICFFCICDIGYSATFLWESTFAWKTLEFEYVETLTFNGKSSTKLEGAAPPGVYDRVIPMSSPDEPNFWFYEVRNQKEWDYFKSLIGIEDTTYNLDFSEKFYVFSIRRKLTGLTYSSDIYWDSAEYGSLVRADFDLDSFNGNEIYLYKLDKKITFYFNQRDYEMSKYNMGSGQFNILSDEAYEPYIYGLYPDMIE